MTDHPAPAAAARSPLVRLLGGGPPRVTLEDGVLRLGDECGIPAGSVDHVQARRSWLWTRLEVRAAGRGPRSIGGLRRGDAELLAAAVRAEAARAAEGLGAELIRLAGRLDRFETAPRYRRHSQTAALGEDAAAVTGCLGALARPHLPERAAAALTRIEPLAAPGAFEAAREAANARHVAAARADVARAAEGVLALPPTEEQAEAIATGEDVTLVLAGAGTGKTSVIAGKVAHLVRSEGVPPGEILVLAFNRKAAEEIRGRLPADLSGATVSTFHAFGRRVIAEVEGAPSLSKLAEDEARLVASVDEILVALLDEPEQSRAVADFVLRHRVAERSQFDFRTPGEYHDYVRRSELRALSGDLVKSFEELSVANFLAQNGVRFEYEADYEVPTATAARRQYRPDFHLPDHGIYIEHFALDREGRAPEGWQGYADGVAWKRSLHAQHGTTLIETHSWQRREGVLLERLRAQLEEAGVALEPVPIRTLLEGLGRWLVTWLAQLAAAFLHHVKTSGVAQETLRERARRSADPARAGAFLDVFEQVQERYERLLGDERDFHDLINDASAHIREGRWSSPYRHVLVDEFQDISRGRMALLGALRQGGASYFLVGDDWQSIYRFAGSDVGLVRDCGHHLGRVAERALTRTFRFGAGVLDPSTAFVTRNPEQTRRELRPAPDAPDGGVTVIAAEGAARGLEEALRDIEAREGGSGPPLSVLVLGRYRGSREALPPRSGGRLRVEYSTVHAAKGREADYAVVLDLRDARRGFPAQHLDDPLMELVLPPPPSGAHAHAEERRLFYVALTRGRRGVYLVADALRPSAFVDELLRESPGLRRLGEFRRDRAAACPRCHTGRLDAASGGRGLRCLDVRFCGYRAPRCPRCRRGFAVIDGTSSRCTNDSCGARPPVCESCGSGVMVARTGRTGRFLGCSAYASDQPCTHTRSLPRRR